MNRSHRAVSAFALLALVASASQASALSTYDFSFSNVDGAESGTVSGQVMLDDGDGVFAAVDLLILSFPSSLDLDLIGFAAPIRLAYFESVDENSFVVSGGAIDVDASRFSALLNGATAFQLNGTGFGPGSFLDLANCECSGSDGVLDLGSATLTYGAASVTSPVPVPVMAPVFAMTLGGLGLLARRRRAA